MSIFTIEHMLLIFIIKNATSWFLLKFIVNQIYLQDSNDFFTTEIFGIKLIDYSTFLK